MEHVDERAEHFEPGISECPICTPSREKLMFLEEGLRETGSRSEPLAFLAPRQCDYRQFHRREDEGAGWKYLWLDEVQHCGASSLVLFIVFAAVPILTNRGAVEDCPFG